MAKDGAVVIEIKAEDNNLKATLVKDQKIISDFANKANKDLDNTGKGFQSVGAKAVLMGQLAFEALRTVANGVMNLGKSVFNIGSEFESAFAGVTKTVDGTKKQLSELKEELIDMSKQIPVSAKELANIAASAGQLGIKIENIKNFTKVMANLSVATNLSSEQAATQLARFANITTMSQNNFEKLGSSIVALGNNMATTESEIVDMALGIAGAGKQVGLAETDILALSASLSSMGVEAQAGSSSISKLIIEMKKATLQGGKDLEKFADVANMSSEKFKNLFDKKAILGIQAFISGLSNLKNRGKDAFTVLDDMGLAEVRLQRALLNLSSNNKLLTDSIAIANKAWKENTALSREVSIRYETVESKMQLLKNKISAFGIAIYDEMRGNVVEAMTEMDDTISNLDDTMKSATFKNSIKQLTASLAQFANIAINLGIKALPVLINAFSWFVKYGPNVAVVFGSFLLAKKTASAYNSLATSLKVLKSATTSATKAQILLNVASVANPYVLLATAFFAVAGAAVIFSKRVDKVAKANSKLKKSIEETRKEYDKTNQKISESFLNEDILLNKLLEQINVHDQLRVKKEESSEATKKFDEAKTKVKETIQQYNKALGDEILIYDEVANKVILNKDSHEELTKAIEREMKIKQASRWLDSHQDEYDNSLQQKKLGIENLSKTWEEAQAVATKYGIKIQNLNDLQKEYNSLLEKNNDPSYWYAIGGNFSSISSQMNDFYSVIQKIKDAQENLQATNDLINTFKTVQESLNTGDFTKADLIFQGLNVTALQDTKVGLEELTKQIEEYKKQRDGIIASNIDPKEKEQMLADVSDQIQQIQKLYDENYKKLEEGADASGVKMGDNLKIGLEQKAEEAFRTIDNRKLQDKHINVYIHEKYSSKLTGKSSGATYLDSEGAVYDNFNNISSIMSNLLPNSYFINNKTNDNKYYQTNNFYRLEERPSETARAIEKVNRKLVKI